MEGGCSTTCDSRRADGERGLMPTRSVTPDNAGELEVDAFDLGGAALDLLVPTGGVEGSLEVACSFLKRETFLRVGGASVLFASTTDGEISVAVVAGRAFEAVGAGAVEEDDAAVRKETSVSPNMWC